MAFSALVFDSGVGGLSVLNEIHRLCPALSLQYLMDNEYFPYGMRNDHELHRRIFKVCTSACEQLAPDLLVVACNTASTLSLPALRKALTIPVVGVVPAIKTAANESSQGHIGLLATPATINRIYTEQLIQEFASQCQISRFGSQEMVELAEHYLQGISITEELKQHLNPWLSNHPGMKHIVLGCTHYPLLKPELEKLWPTIHWLDSGKAIARRVNSLLPELASTAAHEIAAIDCYWTQGQTPPAHVIHYLKQRKPIDQLGRLSAETQELHQFI